MPVKMPHRMPLGQMIIGPDFYGCINTGLAPTLLHSRALSVSSTAFRGFRFVIGPRLYVERGVLALIQNKVPSGRAYMEFDGNRRVTFAKTYATAKRRFAALVEAQEVANRAESTKHQRLLKKARTGDQQAVVDLIDYQ
jgi:hypothetical protein